MKKFYFQFTFGKKIKFAVVIIGVKVINKHLRYFQNQNIKSIYGLKEMYFVSLKWSPPKLDSRFLLQRSLAKQCNQTKHYICFSYKLKRKILTMFKPSSVYNFLDSPGLIKTIFIMSVNSDFS